jgi:hypothetical protein
MAEHYDPFTGDKLSRSEWISWHIQGVIRRWTFFVVFAIITAICWIVDNSHILLWWNLSASALAIFVENAVGIAQFSQTRRDAAIIREIRELLHEVRELNHTDATHSKMDLEVDLDSNQKLTEVLERLDEIEAVYGEYNEWE